MVSESKSDFTFVLEFSVPEYLTKWIHMLSFRRQQSTDITMLTSW